MSVTMRQMLEAGVHFGHQTRFWNPKMAPYIFGHRNKIHIINLEKSLPLFQEATKFVKQLAANRGTILMVGTKRQAREIVAAEARRANVPFVDTRWLGGMLTNFQTIKRRIQRLEALEARRDSGEFERLTKKEASKLNDEITKLDSALGGIRKMRRLPGAVFIVDPHREQIAVAEARRLEIPIVAITDTNCNPDQIDWVIPANDDAIRSVKLICSYVAEAAMSAQQERQAKLDEEFEQAEALPPVDETALGSEADYSAALASGEALVFEPEPEDDEEEERRARARRAAHIEEGEPTHDPDREHERQIEEKAKEPRV